MQKSIENFIKVTENGLYLIDMPTGTGKTTQAIDYIFNHMDKNTTFFYVTSLNKNVDDAYNKLRDKFNASGKLNIFDDMVLRLYSNSEQVIEKLGTVPYNPDDEIMRFNSYIQLKREVEMLDKIVNVDPSIKDKLVTEIREKLEPAFRRDVKIYLNDKFNTKKERFKYIKEHHNWLIQVYPSILTNFRKVFFVSIDKFYLGNDAIIEPSYKFTNNKYLMENTIIFIDEIDAAKNTILSRIVEDSLKNNVDLIKLFLNIYNTLETKEFPSEMLKPTLIREEKSDRYKMSITQRMKELFEEIFSNYNMQYALKLLEKDIDKKFIFDDNTTLTITNKKNVSDMYIDLNVEEGYNRIIFENKNDNLTLSRLIKNITGGISYKQIFNNIKKHMSFSIAEALFADAVILVEGFAEEKMIPYFLNNYPELKNKYIQIVNINGAHGFIYQKLLAALKIPAVILTDVDFKIKSNNSTQITDYEGQYTTNKTIEKNIGTNSLSKLKSCQIDLKEISNIKIFIQEKENGYCATSFEEALILANINSDIIFNALAKFKRNSFYKLVDYKKNKSKSRLLISENINSKSKKIYNTSGPKKGEFITILLQEVISSKDILATPSYIKKAFEYIAKEIE